MTRRMPLAFEAKEPAEFLNAGQQRPATAYTYGSQAWQEMFGPAVGLPAPTEQSALTVSAIYACVSLIAGVIAALPVKIYSRDVEGELDELPNDDLWWLLNEEMLPRWSAANGWEFAITTQLLRGDGLFKIHRPGGFNPGIEGLEPLAYDRVEPIPTRDGKRLIYVVQPDPTIPQPADGGFEVLDQDDVLHLPGFGFNGVRGLSPLRSALRMAAPVALAAQEYQARFFANGARPDYFLSTDATLTPASVEIMRGQIDERHNGPGGWHRPMIGTQGLKPIPLSLPADEMALLPTRQFSVEEIARVFGTPPFMIGHTDKVTAWGTGLEAMGKGFVRYCLGPRLSKIVVELNRKLIRTSRKVIAFDPSDLEAADWKTLLEGYRIAIGRAGEDSLMTVEEIRSRLRLSRTPKYGKLGKGSGNAAPAEPAKPASP